MQQRPVKIVATLGPASSGSEVIERLVREGVDLFRLNFSHGTPEGHFRAATLVREAAARQGRQVALLQDLPGPKVRLGTLPGGQVVLRRGEAILLAPPGTAGDLPVDLPGLASLLEPGDRVLMADGAVAVEVVGIDAGRVRARVVDGGILSSRKGVTLPARRWTPAVPTPSDRETMLLGAAAGVDFIVLSYVGSAAEIMAAREVLHGAGADIPLLAKIETRRALDDLPAILAAADGVMVARGDLGVETPEEEVPSAQKRIVALARREGRPVIVATQMLLSMTRNTRPTRAETADVAGAVWSGADAVMLSEETAVGGHPVAAAATMARIIAAAAREPLDPLAGLAIRSPAEALAEAACDLASRIGAAAIVAATESGYTATAVARFRPACPVVGLTPNPVTARRLALVWGVWPVLREGYHDLDDMSAKAVEAARSLGVARPGSTLVCTAGLPFDRRGGTDLIRIVTA